MVGAVKHGGPPPSAPLCQTMTPDQTELSCLHNRHTAAAEPTHFPGTLSPLP